MPIKFLTFMSDNITTVRCFLSASTALLVSYLYRDWRMFESIKLEEQTII